MKYGLAVLAEGIETSADNFTRFFALARNDGGPRVAPGHLRGRPKTSLVYTTKNEPGALVRSLQPFGTAEVQLTKIESRPSRAAAWEYVFYLDFEGDPGCGRRAKRSRSCASPAEWVRCSAPIRRLEPCSIRTARTPSDRRIARAIGALRER